MWFLLEISVDVEISIILKFMITVCILFENWRASKIQAEKSICITAQIFEKQICESHQFWTICISFFKLEYDRNFQIHWNFEQRSRIAQEFENVRAKKGTLCFIEVFDKNLHFFKSMQIF